MRGFSIDQAHKILLLRPRTFLQKSDIQQAYRHAAKLYHPDSRYPDSTPCAVRFRNCQEARDSLIHYYHKNPTIAWKKAQRANRETMSDVGPARHLRFRKYTMGLKAMFLLFVASEGAYKKFTRKED